MLLKKLWTGKSRLASMKEVSLPRLELLSGLLLAKLLDTVLNASNQVVQFNRVLCWSDS